MEKRIAHFSAFPLPRAVPVCFQHKARRYFQSSLTVTPTLVMQVEEMYGSPAAVRAASASP